MLTKIDISSTNKGGEEAVLKGKHNIQNHQSVMFAGDAAVEFLPPMVVYKSKSIYYKWVRGRPVNTV